MNDLIKQTIVVGSAAGVYTALVYGMVARAAGALT